MLHHLHYSGIYYTIGKADRSTFTWLWTNSVHGKATIHNIWIYLYIFFLKYTLKYVTLEERERKEKVHQYIHDKQFIRQGEKWRRICGDESYRSWPSRSISSIRKSMSSKVAAGFEITMRKKLTLSPCGW